MIPGRPCDCEKIDPVRIAYYPMLFKAIARDKAHLAHDLLDAAGMELKALGLPSNNPDRIFHDGKDGRYFSRLVSFATRKRKLESLKVFKDRKHSFNDAGLIYVENANADETSSEIISFLGTIFGALDGAAVVAKEKHMPQLAALIERTQNPQSPRPGF